MEDKQKICGFISTSITGNKRFSGIGKFEIQQRQRNSCGDFLVRSSENCKCSYGFRNIND